MKRMICAFLLSTLLFVACKKKEQSGTEVGKTAIAVAKMAVCGKEILTDKPVKAGETGIILPAGTKLCITPDNMEIRVELPAGYAFLSKEISFTEKALPVFATYACYCSVVNNACQVFYADGLGFGCLQSSCTGSCTGKFTYKGYSVDRVINLADKESFFNFPEVQELIRALIKDVSPLEAYGKFSVLGVSFYLVQQEKAFLEKASCDCEGTQACKLKLITLPLRNGETTAKKIYFCEGACNGCELTIN
ncbi:MAG: hypothetical protein J0L56_09470 [Chitinophagales bacterium]|nr:hypothetical protein [Chitinophagales bacterium]